MMKRIVIGVAIFFAAASLARAQEVRNEISVQGSGFFTHESDKSGITRTATNSGGVLAGYRYRINRWVSAEANYGYTRNTQNFGGLATGRIQNDVHAVTGDLVVNLPLAIGRFSPYVLAGGGSLTFRPTDFARSVAPGLDTQTQGAFLYGVGTDYGLSRHLALRAEYRGLVYKSPDFSLSALDNDTWTHTAQPSAGIVFRF
jgi:opacity protein-like surface antigen